MSQGMLRALTVTPRTGSADTVLPAAPITARLSDYAITFSRPRHAGTQLVRVQNDG
jgi:hypothetical protein